MVSDRPKVIVPQKKNDRSRRIFRYTEKIRNGALSMTVAEAKTYIEQRSDAHWVCNTRISLDSVVYAFQNGDSPESIVQSFPILNLEQVYGAITFYLANRDFIDAYLTTEEAAFAEMPQPIQVTAPDLYNKLIAAKVAKHSVSS